MKTTLAEQVTVDHRGEAVPRLGQRQHPVDLGPHPGLLEEVGQPGELAPGAHGGADDGQLQEEHPAQLGGRDRAAGRPGDHDPAAGPQRAQRVRPGGLAHRFQHRIDPLRQPGAGREDLVGAELPGPVPFFLAPARGPDPETSRPAEQDQRGRDAATRALDQHRGPRLQTGLVEQHPVGGEVGRGQAGGLGEGQRGGLGHQVAPGHGHPLGERPVVALGEQGPPGIERLVAVHLGRVADHRVHHDLVAVLVDPGRVAAEHHGQPVRGDAHPAQAPHVMVVERGGPHRDRGPAGLRYRFRVLAELQPGQWDVGVDACGSHSEHGPHLSVSAAAGPAGRGRWHIT